MNREYGIWSGRFPIIHKIYELIFINTQNLYDKKCIVIVNPDPQCPPEPKYDRFAPNLNPLTYFDRMIIWKKIVDNINQKVIFIPGWHPKEKLVLENFFLPDGGKCEWIIPMFLENVAQKPTENYTNRGDSLKIINNADEINIAESMLYINDLYVLNASKNDKDRFESCMSNNTLEITKKLLATKGDKYKNLFKIIDETNYIIVPIYDEDFDVVVIYCALEEAKKQEKTIVVFALSVDVGSSEKWWFRRAVDADDDNRLNFFNRYVILQSTMEKIGFNDYLITPIFFNGDKFKFDISKAFLPCAMQKKVWLFKKSCEGPILDTRKCLKQAQENVIQLENVVSAKARQIFDYISEKLSEFDLEIKNRPEYEFELKEDDNENISSIIATMNDTNVGINSFIDVLQKIDESRRNTILKECVKQGITSKEVKQIWHQKLVDYCKNAQDNKVTEFLSSKILLSGY